MAERVGFEPTDPVKGSTVFETVPIDHSGTSPRPGPIFYDETRRLAKNARSSVRLASARSPPRWASGGPRRGSSARSTTVAAGAGAGSAAPQTTQPEAGLPTGRGAHRARLEGDVEGAPVEPPVAAGRGRPRAARAARRGPSGRASPRGGCRRAPRSPRRAPPRTPTGTSPRAAAARASSRAASMKERSRSSYTQSGITTGEYYSQRGRRPARERASAVGCCTGGPTGGGAVMKSPRGWRGPVARAWGIAYLISTRSPISTGRHALVTLAVE